MAAPPELDLPAWAVWGTLVAMACLAALAGATSVWARGQAAAAQPVSAHLRDLRSRLVRAVIALAAAIALVFTVRLDRSPPWVGVDPYDNLAAQVFRRMVADLVPADVTVMVAGPTDGFVALFNVALGLAIVLSLPYLMAQSGGFLWPALRRRERRVLARLLAPAMALFLLGAAFSYVVLLPSALGALYDFAAALGAQPLLNAREFVTFTLLLLGVSGLAFQTPLVMYGVARAGLATPGGYLRKWRHAVVAIVIVAALVTPDPTPVSQMLVAAPLVGLYFLGVAVSAHAARAHARSAGR